MPSAPQIDEPQTLTGLFPTESDDDEDEDADGNAPCFEIQSVDLCGEALKIRQFDYHSHNANRVWPGTFNLADYLLARNDDGVYLHQWGRVLELGTATGLLAIRLALASTMHQGGNTAAYCCTQIVTSDVDDEHGDVAANLIFNYELNEIPTPPFHVPHTWGSGWKKSCERAVLREGGDDIVSQVGDDLRAFDTIVASDILLYVSAYPALVKTLCELMISSTRTVFVMSWNRRMKESAEFFKRMKEADFAFTHVGKCIYIFEHNGKSDRN